VVPEDDGCVFEESTRCYQPAFNGMALVHGLLRESAALESQIVDRGGHLPYVNEGAHAALSGAAVDVIRHPYAEKLPGWLQRLP
jgi:hypothetical protein